MDVLSNLFRIKHTGRKSIPNSTLILVRYVYLDIVGFTYERSVEAQIDIISELNNIIKDVVAKRLPSNAVIYIPVGDGMCIALFGKDVNYESHICIALDILDRIHIYNQSVETMRQFQVRIGINQNDDNTITDINGNMNVIGAGVNLTQRIMSYANGNQILVSRSVYDTLSTREKYMNKFRPYFTQMKHNIPLNLFQYIDETAIGLNSEVPLAFTSKDPTLSKVAAYYLAHCIKNKEFILKKRGSGQDNYALRLLLWYLAKDSVGKSESTLANPYDPQIIETEHNTLDEQFAAFMELPFWVCYDCGQLAVDSDIGRGLHRYFEDVRDALIVNTFGRNKLKSEWPSIRERFDLDKFE